ncbi:hypothetical protein [Moraxella lacunata]|uniref:hypothetical protein n=1 Tax=Moraxella lacunata TaxID=477 RepID=UPI003EE388F5
MACDWFWGVNAYFADIDKKIFRNRLLNRNRLLKFYFSIRSNLCVIPTIFNGYLCLY